MTSPAEAEGSLSRSASPRGSWLRTLAGGATLGLSGGLAAWCVFVLVNRLHVVPRDALALGLYCALGYALAGVAVALAVEALARVLGRGGSATTSRWVRLVTWLTLLALGAVALLTGGAE